MPLHERGGAAQHGIGAFHGFGGNAGFFADGHALADIGGGEGGSKTAAVTNIGFFFFIWLAPCEDAFGRKQGLEQPGGIDQLDAFFAQHLLNAADQRGRVFFFQRSQQFDQAPVRSDAGEQTDVLHLAGHHDFGYLFALEDVDQLAELADVDPVQRGGVLRQFGRRFVFDRDDHDFMAFTARGFQSAARENGRCQR